MSIFDLDTKRDKSKQIEEKLTRSETYRDPKKATSLNKRLSKIKEDIKYIEDLHSMIEEAEVLNELAVEEDDKQTEKELVKLLDELKKSFKDVEIRSLLSGKYDDNDAILSINAGAGGTDACDWVEMLSRMYTKWANSKGYQVYVTDYLWGDEAGYRNIEMIVEGNYAYGYLKAERGVHRLIRISPFDFSGRRHTSFASVDVIPAFGEDIKVEVDPKDLNIETFRASGPGGQHVNVTDSAVRIIHNPTGISAVCQRERSQSKNKQTALMVLKAKLHENYERKRKEEMEKLRGEKREIAWGSQIRTYTMHSYNLVKDHRTDMEDPRVESVLGGDIDKFIHGYLKQQRKKGVKNN